MCRDCGCGQPARKHEHHSVQQSAATVVAPRTLIVEHALMAQNDRQAANNRALFLAKKLLVVNLMSSPGSGKTSLLERTLNELGSRLRLGVIVGDLQTDNDARRLRGRGAMIAAIATGTVCHLEAEMVGRAVEEFDLDQLDILIIENVGNLVCPAGFDLGEELRVVVLSTTEGEDKPLKYPLAFKTAHAIVVNKMDLAEAAGFNHAQAIDNLQRVAPQAMILEVSARTGEGMQEWYAFLERSLVNKSAAIAHH
jgi:hydrogenase nickel incorporation protein HypB